MLEPDIEQEKPFASREEHVLAYCDRLITWYSQAKRRHERDLYFYRTVALVSPVLAGILSAIPEVRHFAWWIIMVAAAAAFVAIGRLITTEREIECRVFAARMTRLDAERLLYRERANEYGYICDKEFLLKLFVSRILKVHRGESDGVLHGHYGSGSVG
jgi:hypothetical protein